jgi:hypothetical protein
MGTIAGGEALVVGVKATCAEAVPGIIAARVRLRSIVSIRKERLLILLWTDLSSCFFIKLVAFIVLNIIIYSFMLWVGGGYFGIRSAGACPLHAEQVTKNLPINTLIGRLDITR